MDCDRLLGDCPQLLQLCDSYAKTQWPVLLLGETGVGKELYARRIHSASHRASGPFVAVNCGSIPQGVFESELFGHERGAFSGALQRHEGLIRKAHTGTLFLDEVGDTDSTSQVKLLRWLDSGEVRPVGGLKAQHSEARVVAATHVDLPEAVQSGAFRLDLLERLSVLVLRIPPLRERLDSIAPIAHSIAATQGAVLQAGVIDLLMQWHWPGNVRQLKNLLLRSIAREGGRISLQTMREILDEEQSFLDSLATGQNHGILGASLEEIERQAILERVRQCHGNKKQAARELGIAKSTLHEKLRRWKQGASRAALSGLDGPGTSPSTGRTAHSTTSVVL